MAALGHLWDANEERGLFRTTDGGQTWQDWYDHVDNIDEWHLFAIAATTDQEIYIASSRRSMRSRKSWLLPRRINAQPLNVSCGKPGPNTFNCAGYSTVSWIGKRLANQRHLNMHGTLNAPPRLPCEQSKAGRCALATSCRQV